MAGAALTDIRASADRSGRILGGCASPLVEKAGQTDIT